MLPWPMFPRRLAALVAAVRAVALAGASEAQQSKVAALSAHVSAAVELKLIVRAQTTKNLFIVDVSRKNIGGATAEFYVREACPGVSLDRIYSDSGKHPLKLAWVGACDDNYWHHVSLKPDEASTFSYTVRLPEGTHRLRAVYEVTKSSLVYDQPGPNAWLGRAESQTVTVKVY